MRARLGSLDEAARRAAGEAIARHLREWESWRETGTVFSFLSTSLEIDTRRIHEIVLADGKLLGLPRLCSGSLTFHRVKRPDALRTRNRYGIREPSSSLSPLLAGSRTVILVPGMAFDLSGGRLGRGGGFYDRYLSGIAATTIGICHSSQILDRVPVGANDIAVRWVATERGLVKTGK